MGWQRDDASAGSIWISEEARLPQIKLSALSSLFDYLFERNAVTGNSVDGVKRPMANGNEGSTPALGNVQARKLLEAPPANTLNSMQRTNKTQRF
jgi:site-specific recombinase XerC